MGKNSLLQSTAKKKTAAAKKTASKTAANAAKSASSAKKKTAGTAAEKQAAREAAERRTSAEEAAAEIAEQARAAAVQSTAPPESESAASEASAGQPQPADECRPPSGDGADSGDRLLKYSLGAVLLLILVVVAASLANQKRFYIQPIDGGIEIQQGIFAPKGKQRLILLPGADVPRPAKAVYAKNTVYPLVFDYFVGKADALLEVPGMPDLKGIRRYLERAADYALTPKDRAIARSRLNTIDLMVLLYRAEAKAGRNTIADLESARVLLAQALDLALDDFQKESINQRLTAIDQRLAQLKEEAAQAAAQAEEAAPAAEPAAGTAAAPTD